MEPMLSQCSANATVKVQFVIRTQLIICLYIYEFYLCYAM